MDRQQAAITAGAGKNAVRLDKVDLSCLDRAKYLPLRSAGKLRQYFRWDHLDPCFAPGAKIHHDLSALLNDDGLFQFKNDLGTLPHGEFPCPVDSIEIKSFQPGPWLSVTGCSPEPIIAGAAGESLAFFLAFCCLFSYSMEKADEKGIVYEFGTFVLDPGDRTLFADGVPLRLPAKEFDTLLLLVEHNGKALSKEEMMTAIWRDSFVEESNLAKQISRLRKILNTNGNEFIETVPKHGYRFSADLRRRTAETESLIVEKRTVKRLRVELEQADDEETLALPPVRRRSIAIPVLMAATLVLGAAGVWFFWQRAASVSKIDTIAVLPIKPLSDWDGNSVLAAGLTDALVTKIGSLRSIIVRPPASVAQFSDAGRDPTEVGRDLHVSAVLEGTIHQFEGKLRVQLRLLNTGSGAQIWSEKFDGASTDLFDLEDRISENVARTLAPSLTDERVTRRYTENSKAFDLYIKGRYFLSRRSEEGFKQAIEYFNGSVAEDPNYSLAYAGLADCYILMGVWGTVPPNDAFPQARQAAEKALQNDPRSVEATVSLAFVEWVHTWDFAKADADFQRAIDLNPNYATAHHWYSYYLVAMGRSDEAIAEIGKARELEGPLSLSINTDTGEILSWARRYYEAEEYFENVLKIEPTYAIGHQAYGINLIKQDRVPEAVAELEKARDLESSPRILAVLSYAYAKAGRRDEALKIIADLNDIKSRRYVSPFSLAIAQLGLDQKDEALRLLEDAYRERSDTMAILDVYPLLDALKSDARFIELKNRVGYNR